MTKHKLLLLICSAFLLLSTNITTIFAQRTVSKTGQKLIRVGFIKEENYFNKVGYFLQLPADYKTQNNRYIFLSDYIGNAVMNIDGNDIYLQLFSLSKSNGEPRKGDRSTLIYTTKGTKVRVDFIVAGLCGSDDDFCLETYYDATITVTRMSSKKTLKAEGIFRSPYIKRQLAERAILTNEWLELIPIKPLKVERDTQEVTLFPQPPIKMVSKGGELVPIDGRDANIEAELIDSNGVIYRSSSGRSETMSGDLRITSRKLNFEDLPKDVTFTKVRIKSSASYPVSKILWLCYNWSDVHH